MKIELTAEEVTEIIRTWGSKHRAPGAKVDVAVHLKSDGGAMIELIQRSMFPSTGGGGGRSSEA